MYDNSGGLAQTGVGITIAGQTLGVTSLAMFGIGVAILGGLALVIGRNRRRRQN